MKRHEIAAKRRKKRKSSCIFAPFASFRGYFRLPVGLHEDFINQYYDDYQNGTNETAESSQIVLNRAKSRQIDAKKIVLQIRLKIERMASPARAKARLSEARVATRPRLQKMIYARLHGNFRLAHLRPHGTMAV